MTATGEGSISRRSVLKASVTPLASIFGSGFLIIVPVLERTIGSLAAIGAAGVCLVAWLVGAAIRHNIAVVEPLEEEGRLDRTSHRLSEVGDFVIAVAYVISVALYLRIMAQYIVGYAGSGSEVAERGIASAAIVAITVVGLTRGFGGLELTERIALGAALALTTLLGGAFLISDAGQVFGNGIDLPPVPGNGIADTLLVLGGILITVQGFETVSFLGDEYDRPTRIAACRFSQLLASSVYIGFAVVCTPLMGLGTDAGLDADLLDITGRVVPLFSLPLVVAAVLSQFSAATADTAAAGGNLRGLFARAMRGGRPYVVGGVTAFVLAWTVPTFTIIAVASRAFAAYYCVQCVIAARSCGGAKRAGFMVLAVLMAGITLLARPAG